MELQSNKLSVTKKFTFEASHKLVGYEGACSRLHGHSYKLYVTVSGSIYPNSVLATDCMVMDFKDLKNMVKTSVIDALDHSYLNDKFHQPTAEVMCCQIFDRLSRLVPKDCVLEKVRLYETEDSYAEICRN